VGATCGALGRPACRLARQSAQVTILARDGRQLSRVRDRQIGRVSPSQQVRRAPWRRGIERVDFNSLVQIAAAATDAPKPVATYSSTGTLSAGLVCERSTTRA
jgi:hypothetical protein